MMIPQPINLHSRRNPRLAVIVTALLAAVLGGTVFGWAQRGDSPITIADGSLRMTSAIPWTAYTGSGNSRVHPHAAKAIPSVEVTGQRTAECGGRQCSVVVTYAGSFTITIATDAGGRNLHVDTDFSMFHQGADATILEHNNANGRITHVKVVQGRATTLLDTDLPGHTVVTIHYQ